MKYKIIQKKTLKIVEILVATVVKVITNLKVMENKF